MAFDLKCLSPNGGCNPLAFFNDGVCSKVWGNFKKSQTQGNGESDKESGNVLWAIVGGIFAWEFVFVCGVVMCNGSVLWWLSVCFD